jgi:hypothetical protein
MEGTINITGNFTEEGVITAAGTITIDDETYQLVELSNPANNFYVKNSYSYGDITVCFLLCIIAGTAIWNSILKSLKK